MMVVGDDGMLVYANHSYASMLGYTDPAMLVRTPLPSLLAAHPHTPPRDCLDVLRAAAANRVVTDWRHTDGYFVRTALSHPISLRAKDPALLINVTDVSDILWEHARPSLTEAR